MPQKQGEQEIWMENLGEDLGGEGWLSIEKVEKSGKIVLK